MNVGERRGRGRPPGRKDKRAGGFKSNRKVATRGRRASNGDTPPSTNKTGRGMAAPSWPQHDTPLPDQPSTHPVINPIQRRRRATHSGEEEKKVIRHEGRLDGSTRDQTDQIRSGHLSSSSRRSSSFSHLIHCVNHPCLDTPIGQQQKERTGHGKGRKWPAGPGLVGWFGVHAKASSSSSSMSDRYDALTKYAYRYRSPTYSVRHGIDFRLGTKNDGMKRGWAGLPAGEEGGVGGGYG